MTYKFYDTCSLLLKANHLFDEENKTASNKDAEIKYSARQLLKLLNENPSLYEIWIFKEDMLKPFIEKGFNHINNDLKILASAFDYDCYKHPDETVFVTNDLSLKAIANCFFGADSIQSVDEE